MPKDQEVTPPDPGAEQVLSVQGDIEILEDNPEANVHNISFDESQHRVVQSRRVPTPDVHISPVHFQERVIVPNVRKHPIALADTIKAYAEATNSSEILDS